MIYKSVLGHEIRKEGAPHHCLDDACAAMKLVLAKLEKGFDDPISVESKDVPTVELTKLLLHRIPFSVPSEDLLKMFSEYPNAEIQPKLRIRGQIYSAYVDFKDPKDAREAYNKISGEEREDSNGRPQKSTWLQLSSGENVTFYVRKMTSNYNLGSQKRPAEDETVESKKQKTSSCGCDHAEEVEKLKQELRRREDEIFNLQKIVSALTRKHGL